MLAWPLGSRTTKAVLYLATAESTELLQDSANWDSKLFDVRFSGSIEVTSALLTVAGGTM